MEVQHSLFDMKGEPVKESPPLVDKRLPKEMQPRLSKQAQAVLARLEQGPASNIELIPISTRFGARVYDLRKAGYIIDMDMDRAKGISIYTLKGKR